MHIFDHTVKPVLLYGSEIWGCFNSKKLNNDTELNYFYRLCKDLKNEKVHLKFCRFTLGVNKHATNLAIFGELGRYPLMIDILTNMIKYWKRIHIKNNILLTNAYSLSNTLSKAGKNCWASSIDAILKLLDLKEYQVLSSKINIRNMVKKKLYLKYCSIWKKELFNDKRQNKTSGNKLRTYRLFKPNFNFEPYLLKLPYIQRCVLTRFRIGAHKLEIEKGRYFNIKLENRICKLCNEEIEDEMHFLLTCKTLDNVRNPILSKIYSKNKNISKLDNKSLFIWLMGNEDKNILIIICQLLEVLNINRNTILD